MQIDLNWILIEIKYPNKCIVCQEKIIVGSKELWKKGEGVKHQKCVGLILESKTIDTTIDTIIDTTIDKQEEPLEKWHDSNIYPYAKTLKMTNCQFCGRKLDPTKDMYMTLDRRSCRSCWGIY